MFICLFLFFNVFLSVCLFEFGYLFIYVCAIYMFMYVSMYVCTCVHASVAYDTATLTWCNITSEYKKSCGDRYKSVCWYEG